MANELALSWSMSFSKGGAAVSVSGSDNVDVSGTKYTKVVQNIGTVDETLALGDVSTIGFVIFKNLDGTNYVQIGADGSSYPVKLNAGETAGPFRWNGAAIHAKANTAACDLEYTLISD